ncbi:MAG: ribosomal protein S18-alanine N-acetyltransferase [Pyrobaculum sp.]
MSKTIRKCQMSDVYQIYDIELKSFKPDDVYSIELLKFLCSFCQDNSYVYVLQNTIVGYIITCIEGNAAHVISIAVSPEHRGLGIGRELLCTALRLLIDKKVKEVFLEARVSNTTALQFYKAAGFEISEILANYYSDGEDGYRLAMRNAERALSFCIRKNSTYEIE